MAGTSSRTNWRRGDGCKEPVTGQGSLASFRGYLRHRRRECLTLAAGAIDAAVARIDAAKPALSAETE